MILGEIIVSEKLASNEKILAVQAKGIVTINTTNQINDKLPALIIGWKKVTEMFPNEEISILSKTIKEGLYWTFSPGEDLQDFNEDIDKFVDELYNDFVKQVTYHFIDPVIEEITTLDNLFEIYEKDYCFDHTYITEDFIYVYDKRTNRILGLDLKYLKFLNFSIKELLEQIKLISCNLIIEDYSENSVYQKYKIYLNKDFDKKYIPYIENSLNRAL